MSDEYEAAKSARLNAESQLANVSRQWPLIRSIVEALRIERQDNHFSERIRLALREPR